VFDEVVRKTKCFYFDVGGLSLEISSMTALPKPPLTVFSSMVSTLRDFLASARINSAIQRLGETGVDYRAVNPFFSQFFSPLQGRCILRGPMASMDKSLPWRTISPLPAGSSFHSVLSLIPCPLPARVADSDRFIVITARYSMCCSSSSSAGEAIMISGMQLR